MANPDILEGPTSAELLLFAPQSLGQHSEGLARLSLAEAQAVYGPEAKLLKKEGMVPLASTVRLDAVWIAGKHEPSLGFGALCSSHD